jgi:hypothetical protein
MTQSKEDRIAKAQSSLPLPEQPPLASDWQSMDVRNVNVGSGGVEAHLGTGATGTAGLRDPSTQGSAIDMRKTGRQGEGGLKDTPKGAHSR